MAVTVSAELPFLVLDEDDRIVEVGPVAEAVYAPMLGHSLWDGFPDAGPLFRPHYQRARRMGQDVEFVQFYRGQVAWLRVVPCGSQVILSWKILHVLDTLTFEGLRKSIADAVALLEEWDTRLRRRRTRDSWQVIEGGT